MTALRAENRVGSGREIRTHAGVILIRVVHLLLTGGEQDVIGVGMAAMTGHETTVGRWRAGESDADHEST